MDVPSGVERQRLKHPVIHGVIPGLVIVEVLSKLRRKCLLNSTDWPVIIAYELSVAKTPSLAGKILIQNVTE